MDIYVETWYMTTKNSVPKLDYLLCFNLLLHDALQINASCCNVQIDVSLHLLIEKLINFGLKLLLTIFQ